MIGDPYDVFEDPYCYEGTDVLKNKAGLRDQALLDDFELEMMNLRAQETLPEGAYDPSHYCAVHHHLIQDVYD
jgi:cell filamentation protein